MKEWVTKTGRRVRISEMEGDHLLNAVKYMEKNVLSMLERWLACGNQNPKYTPMEWLVEQPNYIVLMKEIEKRGIVRLTPPPEWSYSSYVLKTRIKKEKPKPKYKIREFNF